MGRHARVDPATVDVEAARLPGLVEQWHTNCRKCGGLLADEPGMKHCLMCGKVWPIQGARVSDQIRFERQSGLSMHDLPQENVVEKYSKRKYLDDARYRKK